MSEELRPLYAVLAVGAGASQEEVKKAYRRLALEHHPDRGGDAEAFARIALAYEVLGHEQRRRRYDLSGELPQTDGALGRKGELHFLKEYLSSAPRVARGTADESLHALENYEVLEVDGRDVPEYMRRIVTIGLVYLSSVVEDLAEMGVVLLRHFVIDQLYALLAYQGSLDQEAFAERGYVITYYDDPLQPGISATWSDQNRKGPAPSAPKRVDDETLEQRRLHALEWHGIVETTTASPAEVRVVPGEGTGVDRLDAAIRVLIMRERNIGSWGIRELRAALEPVLGLKEGGLAEVRTGVILNIFMAALDELAEVE